MSGRLVIIIYLFLRLFSRWESALPAADLEALLVRPSRNVFDAAVAAFVEVVFFGALRCDKALPEDVFVVLPVLLLRSVFDADEPAFFPVTFLPMNVLKLLPSMTR